MSGLPPTAAAAPAAGAHLPLLFWSSGAGAAAAAAAAASPIPPPPPPAPRASAEEVVRSLLDAGGRLYSRGREREAMALFETGQAVLQEVSRAASAAVAVVVAGGASYQWCHPPHGPSHVVSAAPAARSPTRLDLLAFGAARQLEMAAALLADAGASPRGQQGGETGYASLPPDADEQDEPFGSPDLYLEDECDVGPRALRLPAHVDAEAFRALAEASASAPPLSSPAAPSCSSSSSSLLLLLDAALSFNKALIYHNSLDYGEARRLYRLVLATLQHVAVATSHAAALAAATPILLDVGLRAHNNLGHIGYAAGDEDGARDLFGSSLALARRALAAPSPARRRHRLAYATVLSNWCRAAWMRGDNRSDGLRQALEEVLSVRSSLLGPSHPDTGAAHFNLGAAEYARRNGPEAARHLLLYLRASAASAASAAAASSSASSASSAKSGERPRRGGPPPPAALDPIPALVYLLLIQNEDKDDGMSQELVRGLRTLQDKRQDQGPDSPEVASVLNYVGTLLFHKEDHGNALLFFQEELRLEEGMAAAATGGRGAAASSSSSPHDDISVSVTCNNIGRILQELGRLPDAIRYYHRALRPQYGDLREFQAPGSQHSTSMSVPSFSSKDGGKGAAARSAHPSETDRCCNPSPSPPPPPPPPSANLYSTVWYNLGLIHDKLGAFREAISAFQMSLNLRRSMLGDDHPDIACLLYNIGVLQMEQQDLGAATASFRDALRIRERGGSAPGQLNDRHVVRTLEKLSSLHRARGSVSGALGALEDVLRIQETSADYGGPARSREIGATLRSLSELHHAGGDLGAAVRLAVRSADQLRLALEAREGCGGSPSDPDSWEASAAEQLATSLLLVGSLRHELSEPLLAAESLREAVAALDRLGSRGAGPPSSPSRAPASLRALREVAGMLAASHCAAQA